MCPILAHKENDKYMTTPKSGDWIGEGSKCKHEESVEKYHIQCGSPAHVMCDMTKNIFVKLAKDVSLC